jgi:hypothetical protein
MRIIVGALLLIATATAFAQRVPLGVPLPGVGAPHDRREARVAEDEQDAAQASFPDSAKRDGDEKLTCEQLQAEMTTLQADPAMQALMTSQQGTAGDQLGGFNQTQQLLEQMQANRPSVAGTVVKGMAQSLNPFGQIGAKRRASRQQAEAEAQIAEIQKTLPGGFQLGTDGQPAGGGMPLMMRMGQVMQLAQGKKCDWMSSTQAPSQPQPTEPARERR